MHPTLFISVKVGEAVSEAMRRDNIQMSRLTVRVRPPPQSLSRSQPIDMTRVMGLRVLRDADLDSFALGDCLRQIEFWT
jgi:hypothetical protein